MALTKKNIVSLIHIVRQHAVIYGGSISSADAATREECDKLIDILEKLLKVAPEKTETDFISKKRIKKESKEPKTERAKKIESKKVTEKEQKTTKKNNKPVIKKTAKQVSKKEFKPRIEPVIKGTRKNTKKQPGKRKISAVHLFDAFNEGKLPQYGGYIVSAFFDSDSTYTIIEIVGYDNVREIRQEGETLIFKSAGCKLYTLIEPAYFPLKNVEPNQRDKDKRIPYRFRELNIIRTKNTDLIYIGKEPIVSYASFTVVKPKKTNFCVLFYNVANVFQNMQDFLFPVINKAALIPKKDAFKASREIVKGVNNFHTWLDL